MASKRNRSGSEECNRVRKAVTGLVGCNPETKWIDLAPPEVQLLSFLAVCR